MSTNWANSRKAVANGIVGVVGVAGQLANASVVHGQGALWLAFGITVAQAVAHTLTTYTVPNGATTSQRLAALEKAALPAVETVAVAAEKVAPHNTLVQDVEKVLHVGSSPTTSGAPVTVTPAPVAAPSGALADLAAQVNQGGSNVSG